MKARPIRSLRPSEDRPAGEPRRYENAAGYVRLRWRVGDEYVETYERDAAGTLVRTQPNRARRLDVDEIGRLYDQGLTQREIARKLKCHSAAVSRVLRFKAGRTTRAWYSRNNRQVTAEEVVRLYRDEDRSLHEVARSLNISVNLTRTILRAAGVKSRPVGTRRGPKPAGIVYETEFERARPLVRERSGGICEAQIEGVCHGRASHVHHKLSRGRGGGNELSNLADLCLWCHFWAHHHPKEAAELGLLIHSWDEVPA